MAKLVFLGKLADLAGVRDLTVVPGQLSTILAALPPELAAALGEPRVRAALNGELLGADQVLALQAGDELAFLPPVSGG